MPVQATYHRMRIKEQPISVLERKLFNPPYVHVSYKDFKQEDIGPYHTLYGMAKRGKRVNNVDDLKSELAYSVFKRDKGSAKNPNIDYMNNMFHMVKDNQHKQSKDVFDDLFKGETEKNFLALEPGFSNIDDAIEAYSRGELIKKVFGEGINLFFEYAQEVHINEVRAGTNRYIAHPLRVTRYVRDFLNEDWDKSKEYKKAAKILGLTHDVVESRNKQRKKDIDILTDGGVSKEKDIDILESLSKQLDTVKYLKSDARSKLRELVEKDKQIAKLKQLNLQPPEIWGNEGLIKIFGKEREFGAKVLWMLDAISNYGLSTNNKTTDYENYIIRMYDMVDNFTESRGIKGRFTRSRLDMEEFYDIVPLVKILDAYDNTKTLIGIGAKKEVLRLEHNMILIEHTLRNLEKHQNKMIDAALDKLIKATDEATIKFRKLYLKESHMFSRSEEGQLQEDESSLVDMASDYKRINERLNSVLNSHGKG